MTQNKEQFQQSQSGSGSAEQTGRERSEQQQPLSPDQEQKQDIASQIGEDQNSISSIRETGGLSGRDDASGGSGDRMERESSNEMTDQP